MLVSPSEGSKSSASLDELEAARLCATLNKAEAVFAKSADSPSYSPVDESLVNTTVHAIRNVSPFLLEFTQPESTIAHVADKVRRTFERVRRCASKVVESSAAPSGPDDRLGVYARKLLQESADVLESVLTKLKVRSTSSGSEVRSCDHSNSIGPSPLKRRAVLASFFLGFTLCSC